MNYKPHCARSDERNLILGARGYTPVGPAEIIVEYADVPDLVREIFTHARNYNTILLNDCLVAADVHDARDQALAKAVAKARQYENGSQACEDAHACLNARGILDGAQPLLARLKTLFDLYDNALAQRDQAFAVRYAAREASNRDLEARRRAVREVAIIRASYDEQETALAELRKIYEEETAKAWKEVSDLRAEAHRVEDAGPSNYRRQGYDMGVAAERKRIVDNLRYQARMAREEAEKPDQNSVVRVHRYTKADVLSERATEIESTLDEATTHRDLKPDNVSNSARVALERLALHVFSEPCDSSDSDDDLVAEIIRVLDDTATRAHDVIQHARDDVHQLQKALSEAQAQRPGISWPRRS